MNNAGTVATQCRRLRRRSQTAAAQRDTQARVWFVQPKAIQMAVKSPTAK